MIPKIPQPNMYAIYDPVKNRWSRGGWGPKWHKKSPKTWTMGHLKNHLAMFVHGDYVKKQIVIRNSYDGCKIVDVTTGLEYTGMTIKDYLLKKAIEEANHRPGYKVKTNE